jgi:hypothetical protein
VVVLSTKYLRPASSAMLELKRSFFFSLASRSNFFFVNLHKKFAGLKKIAFSHKKRECLDDFRENSREISPMWAKRKKNNIFQS